MKIQLSQEPIVRDHITIWQEPGALVDMTADLKSLPFRPGSVEQICSFHVLDHMFYDEAVKALRNWYKCLKKGGKLYVVVDDFEYIARSFVAGDITLEIFNKHHSHASQFDRKLLGDLLITTGFPDPNVKVWFADVKDVLPKKHYELVLEATK